MSLQEREREEVEKGIEIYKEKNISIYIECVRERESPKLKLKDTRVV